MHSILEMQDYKETYSALVLLSVLLTSCIKAISYKSFQNGKAQNLRSPWPLDGCNGCFCCMKSPSDEQTICCSASTLQHYRND